jgi:hypothetical protein
MVEHNIRCIWCNLVGCIKVCTLWGEVGMCKHCGKLQVDDEVLNAQYGCKPQYLPKTE